MWTGSWGVWARPDATMWKISRLLDHVIYQVLIHSRAIQTFLHAYLMKKRCPRIIQGDRAKYVWTEPQTARKLLRLDILPSHSAGLYTTPPHTLQSASISFSHFSHFRVPRKALSLKTQTFDQYHSCWGWRVINKVRQSRGLQIHTTCLAPFDTLWLIFQIQNHNKYCINRINE